VRETISVFFAIPVETHDRLALPDPMPGLRQLNFLHLANQRGGKLVGANAHHALALPGQPGMARMIGEVLRKEEAFDNFATPEGRDCWRALYRNRS
jgi:hypothetical protein